MIKNEQRYRNKILSFKEKASIESFISQNVYFLYMGLCLLIFSLISIFLMIIFAFFNLGYASIFFVVAIASFIVSVILIFLLERDIISSKELNERLYIYFDILGEYVKENKSRAKIRMINRSLIRYLNALESNVNNVFIFNSSELNINLIRDIKKVIVVDLINFLKHDKKDIVVELIDNIKKTYLFAEGLQLIQNTKCEFEIEHTSKIDSLKRILEICNNERNNHPAESQKNIMSKVYKKVLISATNPYILIALCTIIGIGLIYYINEAEDYSKMPANLSVVGLILMIIIFIIQSKKRD
ncbi:hypothetical protein SAMN05661091_5297 [Paenibacillus uliginis N3/975]|uniref:Uncharacterized protein n=1 Tax=Paenibacillus uliginis N3/975 TaxID=1313296 RepID=A0A1X7HQA1_9BACL|nr:hypothetical protein [Paenibacillus uliginis]SMF90945.1 hypothetical protein SAMN05661091_5297 [Paenibacillus uliginis N3/975]